MLLFLKVNNYMIYNHEVEFTMMANMHYRRLSMNVASVDKLKVLKTAVILGPNNTGKTNFVYAVAMMKAIMLNQVHSINSNIFSGNNIVEASISFVESGKEYILEIKYDTDNGDYVYERFVEVHRDKYKNVHYSVLILRDVKEKVYKAVDENLISVMKVASRSNILIYLIDTESFPILQEIKEAVTAFASKIDIVDMNNIPIKKTIDMLKMSDKNQKDIANFVLKADLALEDFKYASDDEVKIMLEMEKSVPQETVLLHVAPLAEMLHLVSVYHGVAVPSIIFDSTGTKKIAALASYVISALREGHILVIDELDNSLHFRLTRAIINLFNNELNERAQLIVTAHDVSLLDCRSLFRKEQIWFTHKDKDRAYLYSLSSFRAKDKTRDTSDLISKYRAGCFGALPEPELFDTLLKIR